MRKTILAGLFGAVAGMALTAQFVAPGVAQEAPPKAPDSKEPAPKAEDPKAKADATYEYLNLFGDVFERVRAAYVEPVDEKKVLESAINGMLTSLDPHSSYMPPEDYKDMREDTAGKFGGLGIEVTMEKGFVKVVSPIDDTPAAKAGLQSGDFITHIDGESVLGMTLNDAVDKMRGTIGSKIILTIARPPKEGQEPKEGDKANEPFDVELMRAEIKIKAVKWRAEGDIGYLRMSKFTEQTFDNLQTGIAELEKQIGKDKLRGYVLDLRNNPGGLLSQAVAVSDAFLDKGEIVSTRGRDPADADRYNAQPGDLIDGKPLVVLVNSGSASASEIVSGALQDHRRAVIVGEKTFGKGSVQTIMPLSAKGAIRLTTARYYTPSGRSIQALGIEPDIVVTQVKVEKPEAPKSAVGERSEADLRGSLTNDSLTPDEKKKLDEERAAREKSAKLRDEDYQLSYAVDLLHGLAVYRDFQDQKGK